MEDLGSIPVLGRSSGGGHGNPLQYFCLEISHGQEESGGLQSMGSQRVRDHLVNEQEQQSFIECLLYARYSTKHRQVNTVVNLI